MLDLPLLQTVQMSIFCDADGSLLFTMLLHRLPSRIKYLLYMMHNAPNNSIIQDLYICIGSDKLLFKSMENHKYKG